MPRRAAPPRAAGTSHIRRPRAALLLAAGLVLAGCTGATDTEGGQREGTAEVAPDAGGSTADRSAGVATAGTASAMAAAFGDAGTVSVALTGVLPADAADGAGASCADGSLPVARAGPDRPVATASLVKPYMAAELLHRQRAGQVVLTDRDRSLMAAMMRESDDAAASELWGRYGGGELVAGVAARYGLTATSPPQDPGQWGQTTTTAGDLACFLALLPSLAHPDDAQALVGWLRMPEPIAADGFDQRFGFFGAADGDAAVKQGWACCLDGIQLLHSAGVVDGVAAVLLTESAPEVGYPAVAAGLTAAATVLDDTTG